ncbi:MAG: hypothetical protein R3E50_17205 [Halioglobus sp.]
MALRQTAFATPTFFFPYDEYERFGNWFVPEENLDDRYGSGYGAWLYGQ